MVCQEGCSAMLDKTFTNHSCLTEDRREAMFKHKEDLLYIQLSCGDYPHIVAVSISGISEGDC